MVEVVGLVTAFAVIIFMVNKKQPLALSMILASSVVLVSSGRNLGFIAELFWSASIDIDTVDLALIVAIITSLSGLLNRHGFFDEMVRALRGMLRSDSLTTMIVPGLIGAMPMVGGAIVSAPIVDNLGDRLDLPSARKSAANIIFRHSWYFVFPFMPTYILASRLAGIGIIDLMLIQWPMAIAMLAAGYYFILRRSPNHGFADNGESSPEFSSLAEAVKSFAYHASPLVVGLVLHLVFGVHLALSLLVGLVLAVVLVVLKQKPREDVSWSSLLPRLLTDVDYWIVAAMVAIMIFRASVDQTTTFDTLMSGMLEMGVPLYLVTAGLALLIGFVSASHSSTVAVVIPVIIPIAQAMDRNVLVYVMLSYCFAFLAYLVSPLHLCLILTNRYFDVSLGKVSRLYAPVILVVAVTAAVTAVIWGGL